MPVALFDPAFFDPAIFDTGYVDALVPSTPVDLAWLADTSPQVFSADLQPSTGEPANSDLAVHDSTRFV